MYVRNLFAPIQRNKSHFAHSEHTFSTKEKKIHFNVTKKISQLIEIEISGTMWGLHDSHEYRVTVIMMRKLSILWYKKYDLYSFGFLK